ncbi:MAG: hypothetical protein U1E05_10045, partial [Patescibacteria group bacterium]|nr:hypothetical protein [Patescibacteria group bacterium]
MWSRFACLPERCLWWGWYQDACARPGTSAATAANLAFGYASVSHLIAMRQAIHPYCHGGKSI